MSREATDRFMLDGIPTWFRTIKNPPLGEFAVPDTLRCSLCGWEVAPDDWPGGPQDGERFTHALRFHFTHCRPAPEAIPYPLPEDAGDP